MFAYRKRELAGDLAAHRWGRDYGAGPAAGGDHRLVRPGGNRPGRLPQQRRPSGGPAGAKGRRGSRRARVAPGRPRPGDAGRHRRRDPPGRRVDRGTVHGLASSGHPGQPGRADLGPGHRDRRRHGRRSWTAMPGHGVGDRDLWRRQGRRGLDRGQRTGRGLPRRRGRGLGSRDRPGGRRGGAGGASAHRDRAVARRAGPSGSSARFSPPASAVESAAATNGWRGSG